MGTDLICRSAKKSVRGKPILYCILQHHIPQWFFLSSDGAERTNERALVDGAAQRENENGHERSFTVTQLR